MKKAIIVLLILIGMIFFFFQQMSKQTGAGTYVAYKDCKEAYKNIIQTNYWFLVYATDDALENITIGESSPSSDFSSAEISQLFLAGTLFKYDIALKLKDLSYVEKYKELLRKKYYIDPSNIKEEGTLMYTNETLANLLDQLEGKDIGSFVLLAGLKDLGNTTMFLCMPSTDLHLLYIRIYAKYPQEDIEELEKILEGAKEKGGICNHFKESLLNESLNKITEWQCTSKVENNSIEIEAIAKTERGLLV